MSMRSVVRRPIGRLLCVVLAAAMATGPSAQAWAQQVEIVEEETVEIPANLDLGVVEQREVLRGSDTTLLAAPEAGKVNVTYVSPEAVGLVSLRPHQLLTSPKTALWPVEVVSAAGIQHLGIDPADISEVVVFVEPPLGITLPYGVVIKFTRPFSLSDVREQFRAHTQPADFAGKPYLRSADMRLPSLYMPDDRTLLVMTEPTLQKALVPQGPPKSSPLLDRVRALPGGDDLYALVEVKSLRPIIGPLSKAAAAQPDSGFPEEARPFLEVIDLVSAVDLSLNLTNTSPSVLALHADNAASADRLEVLYSLAKEMQRKQAMEGAAVLKQSQDPVQRAFGNYIERASKTMPDAYQIERRGDNLVLFEMKASDDSTQNQLVMVAVAGVLVALILPAIQAAREAARRSQSMNNLKQIMLAMLNYHDARKAMPPHAIYSADGKPLLSWRVMILPYIEEAALYARFKLDEPWDSPHNKALIPLMPAVYDNPNFPSQGEGMTNYLAFVGPECVMDGTSKGVSLRHVTDGTSKTVVVVEADLDQAVVWTKPDDLEFDANNPKAGFGKLRPGGCNVTFNDGSVHFLRADIDPATMKAVVTKSGGEVFNWP